MRFSARRLLAPPPVVSTSSTTTICVPRIRSRLPGVIWNALATLRPRSLRLSSACGRVRRICRSISGAKAALPFRQATWPARRTGCCASGRGMSGEAAQSSPRCPANRRPVSMPPVTAPSQFVPEFETPNELSCIALVYQSASCMAVSRASCHAGATQGVRFHLEVRGRPQLPHRGSTTSSRSDQQELHSVAGSATGSRQEAQRQIQQPPRNCRSSRSGEHRLESARPAPEPGRAVAI